MIWNATLCAGANVPPNVEEVAIFDVANAYVTVATAVPGAFDLMPIKIS